MRITFVPIRTPKFTREGPMAFSLAGDVLTINGESFDLGPLPEGFEIQNKDVDPYLFRGPVSRLGGTLHLSLLLWTPHGGEPFTLDVTEDGPIAVAIPGVPA